MRNHPATIHGYHTTSGAVCADCAQLCPELVSGPREPIRTYDADIGRECLACGDTFAGPITGLDPRCFTGEEDL